MVALRLKIFQYLLCTIKCTKHFLVLSKFKNGVGGVVSKFFHVAGFAIQSYALRVQCMCIGGFLSF